MSRGLSTGLGEKKRRNRERSLRRPNVNATIRRSDASSSRMVMGGASSDMGGDQRPRPAPAGLVDVRDVDRERARNRRRQLRDALDRPGDQVALRARRRAARLPAGLGSGSCDSARLPRQL